MTVLRYPMIRRTSNLAFYEADYRAYDDARNALGRIWCGPVHDQYRDALVAEADMRCKAISRAMAELDL